MGNQEMQLARDIIEKTGTNLFLTGKAGTGKTTFLRRLCESSPKRMVVLAPTGIAAINAGGVTIHSFFQLSFGPYVPGIIRNEEQHRFSKQKRKLIRSLDLVVIDEISMVRADLLDHVDVVLRRFRDRNKPFGGVQLLLIGDLQQLAPVAKEEEWMLLKKYYETPYFFSSRALKETNYLTIELKHVYRQQDENFIRLLNLVREGSVDDGALVRLNERCKPGFNPAKSEGYIRLVTHNRQADKINEEELSHIENVSFQYEAQVKGNFPEGSYPADKVLELKLGAQIMFIKNDSQKRYFNGMLGEVVAINKNGFTVHPLDAPSNIRIDVEREEWTNVKYVLNEETNEVEEKVEGVFVQFPVRLAWAITIHKSQGLTFERAIIDTHWAFAHGQTYVALSRCKSLEGLVLSTPIPRSAIICDRSVSNYSQEMGSRTPDGETVKQLERSFYKETLFDLLDFTQVRYGLDALLRLLQEHFYKLYPQTVAACEQQCEVYAKAVEQVAFKFSQQIDSMMSMSEDFANDSALHERLSKGAVYFKEQMSVLGAFAKEKELPTDNKELKKRTANTLENLREQIKVKSLLFNYISEKGFQLHDYLNEHSKVIIGLRDAEDEGTEAPSNRKSEKKGVSVQERVFVPSDILNPKLYETLVKWRYKHSQNEGLPAYVVLQQKALIGIVNLLPDSPEALKAIPYFGEKSFEKYGEEILELVYEFMKETGAKRPEIKIIKEVKQKGQKREKAHELTYRQFREGKTLAEMAHERILSVDTVVGHLIYALDEGKIKLEEFLPAEKIAAIKAYLEKNGMEMPPLHQVRVEKGQDFLYNEVKAVYHVLTRDKT